MVGLAACVAVALVVMPSVALAYPDWYGGGPTVRQYLPYTEQPTLHPDRVDEINARRLSLPYTQAPTLHPDRVDEINARRAYLPYTEQHVLPPGADAAGVHFPEEEPGSVKHGGRALLSDEAQALGKSVLVVKDGTLYQLSHE